MKTKAILTIFLLLFLACNESTKNSPDSKKLILGQWEMVNFSTNQIVKDKDAYKKAAKNIVLTTHIIIEKNKFESEILGGKTSGTWVIDGNKLIVWDKKKRTKSEAEIVKLDREQLVLMQKHGKVKTVLYFRRMEH